MTRLTIGIDRFAAIVLGLVLLAVGGGAAAWQLGVIPDAPDELDLGPVLDLTDQGWWQWALAGAGLVLGLLALRWIAAHLRRPSVPVLSLPGSSMKGRLRADPSALATVAATDLAERGPISSAKGHATRDQKVDTIELDATIEPTTALQHVEQAVESTAHSLSVATGGSIALRVRIHVSRS